MQKSKRESSLEIIDAFADQKNYNSRISSLILHYTAVPYEQSLRLLQYSGVSAHFLVSGGNILQLVNIQDRAWHAGVSYWQNRHQLNDTSIGIEIINQGFGIVQPNGDILYPWQTTQKIKNKLESYLRDKDKTLLEKLTVKKLLEAFLIEMLYGRIPPEEREKYEKAISLKIRENYKIITQDIRVSLPDVFMNIDIANLYKLEQQGKIVWETFPLDQIQNVIKLVKHILKNLYIAPTAIISHADIAPMRKQDPGPKFPWKMLAEHGIGAWPDEETVRDIEKKLNKNTFSFDKMSWLQDNLSRYGYDVFTTGQYDLQTQYALIAFQMHFRPSCYDGVIDNETIAILAALMKKYYAVQNPFSLGTD